MSGNITNLPYSPYTPFRKPVQSSVPGLPWNLQYGAPSRSAPIERSLLRESVTGAIAGASSCHHPRRRLRPGTWEAPSPARIVYPRRGSARLAARLFFKRLLLFPGGGPRVPRPWPDVPEPPPRAAAPACARHVLHPVPAGDVPGRQLPGPQARPEAARLRARHEVPLQFRRLLRGGPARGPRPPGVAGPVRPVRRAEHPAAHGAVRPAEILSNLLQGLPPPLFRASTRATPPWPSGPSLSCTVFRVPSCLCAGETFLPSVVSTSLPFHIGPGIWDAGSIFYTVGCKLSLYWIVHYVMR